MDELTSRQVRNVPVWAWERIKQFAELNKKLGKEPGTVNEVAVNAIVAAATRLTPERLSRLTEKAMQKHSPTPP